MAEGIRISQLPTITAMTDDDVLIVNDGNASTRRITFSNFKTSVANDLAPVTSVNGQTGVVTIDANSLSVYTKAEVDANLAGYATNTLAGVVNGSSDLGAFNGATIPDNVSVKGALQALETAVEGGDAQDAILSANNVFTGTNEFQGTITASQNGNIIPFYFDDQAAFPAATTYHGAVAHSHADGKMYFAHGGGWVALANGSEVFSGAYGDLTGAPTLGTAAATDATAYATAAQGTTADSAVQPAAGAITVTSLATDGSETVDTLATAINTLTAELAAILNA